jgi:hypothetical protein
VSMAEALPDVSTPASFSAPASSREAIAVQHRSFPLVVLLQLATVCAALLACVDGSAVWRVYDAPNVGTTVQVLAMFGVLLAGGVIGALVGLGQIRKWRSALLGFFFGALSGFLIMCIYAAPASVTRIAAAAAVIVLSTVIVRLRAA